MSFPHKLSVLYDSVLAVVYPQACAGCGASVEARADGVACAMCWRETRTLSGEEAVCWKCGALTPGTAVGEKLDLVRCRRCDNLPFTAARACGIYEAALRVSVLTLKREPRVPLRLARLLLDTQQRQPLNRATCIIPVPLHPERKKERGFNQAAVLGCALAQMSRLALDETSLVRVAHTERHRTGMDGQARRESVENVFEVRHPRVVRDERVLLIDDVFTTGATASSCARVLLDAGASEVFVLTVARAPVYA